MTIRILLRPENAARIVHSREVRGSGEFTAMIVHSREVRGSGEFIARSFMTRFAARYRA